MNEALSESKFDSTQILLNSLNYKIVEFEKQNQVLRDSVVALTKTIEKAGIKTEFYTDQLNFQLFWFSIILAVVGLISWNGIIRPINNRLRKIEDELIPKIKEETSELIISKISTYEDRFEELSENANEGISWGLKSFASSYLNESNWKGYILMSLRHIHLCFRDNTYSANSEMIVSDLNYILELSLTENYFLSDFDIHVDEITKILSVIKMCETIPEASELAFKISIHYSRNETKPETSYDADNSEYSGPRTISSR